MKYAQKIIIILVILCSSCAERNVKYTSVLHCNSNLIVHSLYAWNENRTNEECGSSVAAQFNKGMDVLYGKSQVSTSHERINPIYYDNLYALDNAYNNMQWDLKHYLNPKQPTMSITDSLTFDKKISFRKNDQIQMSTNLKLTLYQIEINNDHVWVLSKIKHEDFYAIEEGFSVPIFKYNYQIINNEIYSYLTCSINVEKGSMNRNYIPIVLKDIRVENNTVLYDDVTKRHYLNEFKGEYEVIYE